MTWPGGVMPCGRFGANAAWLRLAVITYNVLTALKRLALPPELLTAPKRPRFLIYNNPGKLGHHARRTLLRLVRIERNIIAQRQQHVESVEATVCGSKAGTFQSGWHCPKCSTYMHFNCSVEKQDGYCCPNCNSKI